MNEIATTFEGILWFIYRVLFSLLPSVLFLVVLIIFGTSLYCDCDVITSIKNIALFQNFSFGIWIILFAAVFCINTIFDSSKSFILLFLNFKNICNQVYEKDKSLSTVLEDFNPKILNYLKSNDDNKIVLNDSVFNLSFILTGEQKSNSANNHLWFLRTNEFIYTNTATALILSSLILLPLYLFKNYELTLGTFWIFQFVQLLLVLLVFCYSKIIIALHYKDGKPSLYLPKSKVSRVTIIPLIMIITSIVLFICDLKPIGLFILSNGILFFVSSVLFLRALREYFHVEYCIMMITASRYDKERTEAKTKIGTKTKYKTKTKT